MRSKNISDKVVKRTKPAKRNIILSISSTELTKLKGLIKFKNHLEVPIGQSLGQRPPDSEPQLKPYELIKRCRRATIIHGIFETNSSFRVK